MYKVMIVDDEDIVRIGLQTLLTWEHYGFQIAYKASNGVEAIEIAKREKPDLIISDVVMPIMDGIEMVKCLKEIGYDGEIIIISNHNNLEAVKQLIRFGVEDYLLKISYKPEEFIVLLENVKKKLNKKKPTKKSEVEIAPISIKKLFFENEDDTDDIIFKNVVLFYIEILNDNKSNMKNINEKVKVIIGESFKNYKFECFSISENEILALVNYTDENFIHVHTEVRIKKMLKLYTMLDAHVLSVYNIGNLTELKQQVKACRKAEQNRFYGEVCGNLKAYKNTDINQCIDRVKIVSQLIQMIDQHQLEKVEEGSQKILIELKNNFVNPDELLNFVSTIFIVLSAQIDQIYNVTLQKDFMAKIKACTTFEAINEVCMCILKEVKVSVEVKKQEHRMLSDTYDDEIIANVMQYIHKNIHCKITLGDIAKEVNVHPNYLSSYFNKKVKCSLPKYINNHKLEYAKKLLETENVKVKEVASMIGIYDVSYFSKLYKEKFGYYPSETESQCKK